MRWIKYIVLFFIVGIGGYFALLHSVEEQERHFVIEQEVAYPVEKVFPQFENFQNFTRWSGQFSGEERYSFRYFEPYEGVGSAMSYQNIKDKDDAGDLFIRSVKSNKSIKYEIYKKGDTKAYKVEVKFQPKGEKTKITWNIEAPVVASILQMIEVISEEDLKKEISQGTKNLVGLLSGKIDQEILLGQIKYDSIIIEDREAKLLLGMNTSTNNKKGMLYKNITLNHHKVLNFVSKDLAKRDDEFGLPILITEVGGLKAKDVSYFYGVPVSKQESISDNNFIFRTLEKSKVYSIYYKGNYDQRVRSIDKLLREIKKDSLQSGLLEETFVQPPMEGQEVVLKLSLEAKR